MKLRLFIIQSVFTIVCWLELVVAVHYWSCSSLHVPDVVSCTCEVPQVLQCLGSKGQGSDSVFVTISSLLSTLPPDNAVSVLELSLIGSSTIPADSFKGTGLHGLVVSSHGSLQLSQFSFRGLENFLLALGLPFNELDEIPVDPIRLLRGLERLDLSNNAITRVSEEDLVALSDLEEINMANNRISVIDRTCFRNNRKLKKIILDGNSLGTSSMDWNHSPFDDLPVLENFFVENNGFSGVLTTTKLPKNVNLMRLNLAFNNFSRVSRGAFSGLPNLQFLDLSHNNLVVIEDGAFQSCALLEILDLQHNRLKDMSERTFNGLISLAYLYLSDNYLDIIDEGMFKPLMAIRYVSAKDNEISHIHPSAFAEARFLESLDLEDNNLMCDCKLKGFATWLKTVSSITPAQKSAITCETPMNPEPRVIMDLDPSDFVCSNEVPLGPLAIIQKEEEEKQHKEKEDDNDGGHNARHFTAVSESGLELSDYQYKSSKNVLSLIWVVDERSIPYECDAVFIFKEEDGNHQLKSKTKVMCHSNSESNPKRLTIRLNHLDLEMNQTYRFCLVVFSSATLVAGCSESLHLRVGATGKELYGVAISPHSKWNSDDHSPTTNPRSSIVPRPTLKVNWVNGSTLDTVTVWWDFVAGLQQLPTSCLLNVSLIAGNKVAIEKRAKCAKGRTNFTNLNPLETYEVCISIVQPHPLPPATASLLHGDNRCVDIRPTSLTATPITSNRLLITVITTILVCIVMLLMGAIFLLARRICWPSSKSDNLLSPPCRDGPQYRVLYHQPEEGPRPSLLHSRTASSNEITPV